MKTFINTIAGIVFMVQTIASGFNILTLKKPESTLEALHNHFTLTASLCSLLSVVVFVLVYNCNFSFLRKKITNMVFVVIVLPGCYINFSQLFITHDLIASSCVMLIFDCYIIRKVLLSITTFRRMNKIHAKC